MKRESDCSTTSSLRNPRSSETASFAWRIFPSRSETNTGSGAFAMMMSATSAPRDADPSCCAPPFDSVLGAAELKTFLATGFASRLRGAMRVAYSLCSLQVLGAMVRESLLMRVAVVGHVEWIEFARVERLPAAGEIVHASHAWEEPGGGGAVAAVQLARLAEGCLFLTALGDNELGRRAKRELEEL